MRGEEKGRWGEGEDSNKISKRESLLLGFA